MKNSVAIVLLIIVAICADACSGKDNTKSWNESEPAVITGYIRNQKIYPQCKSITVSMPFFDRIDFSYTTEIDSNGFFKMEVYPYYEREISMLPYIDRFLIAPGDSLIIEIDFSDLSKIKFSGKSGWDNACLHSFYTHIDYNYWPIDNTIGVNGFSDALDRELCLKLERFNEWEKENCPSDKIITICKRQIMTSYWIHKIEGLFKLSHNISYDINQFVDFSAIEKLFEESTISADCFKLSRVLESAVSTIQSQEEKKQLAAMIDGGRVKDAFSHILSVQQNNFKNRFLREMLTASLLHRFLENNQTERFTECMDVFENSIHHPLLKNQLAKLYTKKIDFKKHPKRVSDLLVKAGSSDGMAMNMINNEGVSLLEQLVSENPGKALYITVGAFWCHTCLADLPYKNALVEKTDSRNILIVSLYLDSREEHERILNYNGLTDKTVKKFVNKSQSRGLDAIFHLNAIPFFFVIDKDGRLVDYGMHLRPSYQETMDLLDKLSS